MLGSVDLCPLLSSCLIWLVTLWLLLLRFKWQARSRDPGLVSPLNVLQKMSYHHVPTSLVMHQAELETGWWWWWWWWCVCVCVRVEGRGTHLVRLSLSFTVCFPVPTYNVEITELPKEKVKLMMC